MVMHKAFVFLISLLAMSGLYGQYEFDLICGDTVATVVLPVDAVHFFVGLENTGSVDDVYRITLLDRTPSWYLLFCVGGVCYPAGGLIYDTLLVGQQEMIEVTFSNILQSDTGSAILHVQSLGDSEKSDSVTLWVLATTSIHTDMEDRPIRSMCLRTRPNPFVHRMAIAYQLTDHQHASLQIYSIGGQSVKTFVNGEMNAGYHMHYWDGTDTEGREVAPGIYLCVLQARNSVSVSKIIRLRGQVSTFDIRR